MKTQGSIKYWSEDDRPREKLMTKGCEALSDSELIAILLGSGNKNKSAVELSREILKSVKNDLNDLGRLNYTELMKFRGVGEAKAISVIAALELGRRRKVQHINKRKQITCSSDVYESFQPLLADKNHEEFWFILLNNSNMIIDKIKTSQGGTTGTVIDVKLIMKEAMNKLAQGIILVHNHPSGNIKPSNADRTITEKIKNATSFFDIKLLDHVIIGDSNYFSFADENCL